MGDGPTVRLREQIRALFLARGFARVGFTSAEPVADHVSTWVAQGRHGSMDYLAREPAGRADPGRLLPGARTVICTTTAYPATDGRGSVAGYARGEDYHHTLKAALRDAVSELETLLPGVATRVCVDTAPLLERALAARAGLGWIGRNTLLLDETHGPWTLLGEVILDAALPPDTPGLDRCGTCTACLDACPTGALDGARGLDARLCLSYWTIEHRGEVPDRFARLLDQRAFGCDDCLAACPHPARPPAALRQAPDPAADGAVRNGGPAPGVGRGSTACGVGPPFVPRSDLVDVTPPELGRRAEESFRRHFSSTPVERTRRAGLLRNVSLTRPPPSDV